MIKTDKYLSWLWNLLV